MTKLNTLDPGARHYVGVTAHSDDHTFPRQTKSACAHAHRSPLTAVRCGAKMSALAYNQGTATEYWGEPVPNPAGRQYRSAGR